MRIKSLYKLKLTEEEFDSLVFSNTDRYYITACMVNNRITLFDVIWKQ